MSTAYERKHPPATADNPSPTVIASWSKGAPNGMVEIAMPTKADTINALPHHEKVALVLRSIKLWVEEHKDQECPVHVRRCAVHPSNLLRECWEEHKANGIPWSLWEEASDMFLAEKP